MRNLFGKLKDRLGNPFSDCRVRSVPEFPESAQALLAWLVREHQPGAVLFVTDGPQTLEVAHRDLMTLWPHDTAPPLLYFPAWETLPSADGGMDPEIVGNRLQTLLALGAADSPSACVITTCAQALMQQTFPAERIKTQTQMIARGDEVDLDLLYDALLAQGYEFEPEVLRKGQASRRGGILDIWPYTSAWPLRIEFFGNETDSIRTFDPVNQHSIDKLNEIRLAPVNEWAAIAQAAAPVTLLDHLPKGTVFIWSGAASIEDRAAVFEEAAEESRATPYICSLDTIRTGADSHPGARQLRVGADDDTESETAWLPAFTVTQSVLPLPHEPLQPDAMEQMRSQLFDDLAAKLRAKWSVTVTFDTTGAREHFENALRERYPKLLSKLDVQVGALSGGFVCEALKIAVIAEADLYGRRRRLGRRYQPTAKTATLPSDVGQRVAGLEDIEPGQLVIHVDHGLGRYVGLSEIEFNGQRQEVLTIEYDQGARLHVPTSHAHLLSRYIGTSRERVRLHRLGGKRWNREKEAARDAIADLAASLLETQAARDALEGTVCGPDTPWQHEFENAFPFQETVDQTAVIAAVKEDMQSPRPMDRLVCGDAGYGKTEVAMRAAFKTVMDQRQVAVLVPTTVLAQQHYQTFTERMAAYPVRIEMLSRFRTGSQRQAILNDLAEGRIDIIIGTHAMVQPHVRFQNLGLAIIDEEQRFGVAHKERLKEIRRLVDVLTMTATPIPRTLYMSLTGARDMSLLQTPPQERVPIQTIVAKNQDKVIREAVLRELNREGQVFYLYNRVMTIDWARERLERIVPEASIRVAHGQMSPRQLSGIVRDFSAGAFDILLCTTIVESGVDIPRANTILIDRADRFGIADLYQLRGRVGRSHHKAYAYLLLPAHGHVDPDARSRIQAVRRYSGKGAGFNLAMRDLEIRGSGNLLGARQSGHIAAIGFGLYCQLLQRTIARLKGRPLPRLVDVDLRIDFLDLSPTASTEAATCLPYTYIEDERLRIQAYRQLAEATTPRQVESVTLGLVDRFGSPPAPARRLAQLARIRVAASELGVRLVETRGSKLILHQGHNQFLSPGSRFPRLAGESADERLAEILALLDEAREW